jgi:hypothetical protein
VRPSALKSLRDKSESTLEPLILPPLGTITVSSSHLITGIPHPAAS